MTFFSSIETPSWTLTNEDGPVVTFDLSGNNEKPFPGRKARLHTWFHGDYPAEWEIEPGPNCHPINNIVSQFMLWGETTPDGTGRGRLTTQIVKDPKGGQYAQIDSSTNDPSGSVGQKRSMPLVFNTGEGKGIYVALYPSDNTIDFQDRVADISTGRISAASIIRHLRRIPK